MITITKEYVTSHCDKENKPVAFCKSGDVVRFETRDCYDERLQADGTEIEPEQGIENPATGPLFVEGAEPGDTLKIEIQAIDVAETGLMRTSIVGGAYKALAEKRETRQFKVKNGKIDFAENISLELDPMIGVIGTAPAGEAVPNITPGRHGGNMDCRKIQAGTTLYLPVEVKGGLLVIGDLHGLMGDGESLICGLEMSGAVTVKVEVLKNCDLPTPFLETDTHYITIQSGETFEEAAVQAANAMHQFIGKKYHLNIRDTGMFLSLKGNLIMCQMVNPLMTVRMEVEKM